MRNFFESFGFGRERSETGNIEEELRAVRKEIESEESYLLNVDSFSESNERVRADQWSDVRNTVEATKLKLEALRDKEAELEVKLSKGD